MREDEDWGHNIPFFIKGKKKYRRKDESEKNKVDVEFRLFTMISVYNIYLNILSLSIALTCLHKHITFQRSKTHACICTSCMTNMYN